MSIPISVFGGLDLGGLLHVHVPGRSGDKSQDLRVRRIIGTPAKDLHQIKAACDLLRSIPENQRDSYEDMVRWQQETQEELHEGRANWDDYFVIAEIGDRVVGFFYGHHCLATSYFVISYFVTDHDMANEGIRPAAAIAEFMVEQTAGGLGRCKAVLAELSPASERDRSGLTCLERNFRGLARCFRLGLRRLEIPYLQPRVSLRGGFEEEPLLLAFGVAVTSHGLTKISRAEAVQVLDTIYNHWYADSFEDEPDRDHEYRRYLREVFDRVTKGLPEQVGLV